MSAFNVDTITPAVDGSFFATVTGGTPGYTWNLDGGAFGPVTAITFNGVTNYFLSATAGGAAVGMHTVIVRDSASPYAEITQQFEVMFFDAVAGCSNTGAGNAMGVIETQFDFAAHPGWYTQAIRNDGQPIGSLQTGREPILVFLENGNFTISLYDDSDNLIESKTVAVLCGNSTPLNVVSVTTTNVTTPTATDGTAMVLIEDGQGAGPDFKVETHTGDFNWQRTTAGVAPSFTANLTNLSVGPHTVFVRDSALNTTQFTFNVGYNAIRGCTSPAATNYNPNATDNDGSCVFPPLVAKPYISVSLMNTFRFVETSGYATANMDNRLYCDEDWGNVTIRPYYQKIAYGDNLTTQFRSNYAAHLCEICRVSDDFVVDTPVATLKKQNTGIIRQYAAWLAPHPTIPTSSRLYFNGGILPLAFVIGDEIQISNATHAALNNRYSIGDINFDSTQSIPYLIINAPFPVTAPATTRIDITAVSQYDVLPYNVFEFTPDTDNIPDGEYYAQISTVAEAGAFVERVYRSEPFAFYPTHENTVYIAYRNFDDDMGLTFTTGLQCGLRVESDFWQRQPGGTRKLRRLPDGRLEKLTAVRQRKIKLQLFKLPPWLHEKIAFLFDFDNVTINGVEFQSEDGYSTPSYTNRYALCNAEIVVEQIEPFTDQNGTDLGGVNIIDDNILIANGQYLKA